jgi:hypothetical protein
MQECFNNEAFCKKRAAGATDTTASAVFAECARCWRELADCWRELTSMPQDSNDGAVPVGDTRNIRRLGAARHNK